MASLRRVVVALTFALATGGLSGAEEAVTGQGPHPELTLAESTGEHGATALLIASRDTGRREELVRLEADLTIGPGDRASARPICLLGWAMGRPNEWGDKGQSTEEVLADMLNDMGCTLPVGITIGLLTSPDPSDERAGACARDAIIATSAATHLLKSVIDSPRPCNPDNLDGFPSGHTAMSVAFARAIASQNTDWGTVAYVWAGGVGWSRVRRGDHTVGQVVAGALLGWFVADMVVDEVDTAGIVTPRGGGPMIPAGRASW